MNLREWLQKTRYIKIHQLNHLFLPISYSSFGKLKKNIKVKVTKVTLGLRTARSNPWSWCSQISFSLYESINTLGTPTEKK